jgi:MobA/VirD2-like, nuclease domain
MPRRVFRIRGGAPLLDIVSYGRGGYCDNGGRLTPDQIEQIRRTVQRAPEVMVKVLPRASNDLKAAGQHLDYITRYGQFPLETDDGDRLEAENGKAVLEGWDVDIDDLRRQATLTATKGRKPPKLVHKLMFSMPAGTPPDTVLGAVRNFAREEFWGQHRYAFVLHTDEDHPHVHLVLKAVSEQGVRLNIKKVTLRYWRSEFARHLRELGVPANATDRAVRGQYRKAKKDGIYRASQRGDSTYVRAQAEAVASQLLEGRLRVERGKTQLVETRRTIEHGWRTSISLLRNQGQSELAAFVARFVDEMSPPATEKEFVAAALAERVGQPALARAPPIR